MCKVCYLQSLQFAIGAPHVLVMLSALYIPIGVSFNGTLIRSVPDYQLLIAHDYHICAFNAVILIVNYQLLIVWPCQQNSFTTLAEAHIDTRRVQSKLHIFSSSKANLNSKLSSVIVGAVAELSTRVRSSLIKVLAFTLQVLVQYINSNAPP